MSVTLAPPMFTQLFNPNNSGSPAIGFKLFTYAAGTSTKQATWTDSSQLTQNANPLSLDSIGTANVWGDPTTAYKFVWAPANDTDPPSSPIKTVDNLYFPLNLAALTQAVIGSILYPQTAAESAAGVTPTNYAYPSGTPYYDTRRTGAIADGATDNTAAVQKAVNAVGQVASSTSGGGGTVWNAKGCKFNLSTLTFPARCVLQYYGGDDTSDSSVYGTNELRTFIANANASGIVNEQHVEAPFNPGLIINVRKNISGQDAWLGGGQSRTNPARASFAISDEDLSSFAFTYAHYPVQSNFSGTTQYGLRQTYTLNGITNTSFSGGAPTVNATLTGNTSGAKGYVFSSDASKTIVIWTTGKFQTGETVTQDSPNIVSSTTISSAVYGSVQSVSLGVGLLGNGWSIGMPNDLTTYPLNVGGPIGIQATRTMGQYVPVTYASPYFELVDSYENSPPNGFQIFYNTVPSAANRRLTLRKYNTTTDIAALGAVRAYGGFTDAGAINASSYNIASITKNGTGDYTVNFTVAFTRADYSVSFGPNNGSDYPFVFSQATGSVRIQVATNGTPGTLRNIGGTLNIMCLGGDI